MLKTILVALAVLVIAVLLYAASRPDTFRVERAISIKAPAEKIFPLLNDFRQWSAWSPYEKLDPQLKRNFSGAPAGIGAVYAWEGNAKVGEGRMEIIESVAPTLMRAKLEFVRPFKANNTAEFQLAPQGDETKVTWAMYGPNAFMAKVMGLFFDMDRLVGGDFESGLAALKANVEGAASNGAGAPR